MRVEQAAYITRAARTHYIFDHYRDSLRGKILDVGCDMAVLKSLLSNPDYTGIDIGGTPDIRINLETADRLPFDDRVFDCVVCADVLEHLDNLHRMFDELVRVARRDIILSLPNCWSVARVPIGRGTGSFAHYGLPAERPADRHKWFFSLTQAVAFIDEQARRQGLRIVEMHATEKPKFGLVRFLRRMRYPRQNAYLNRYAHTLWIRLEVPPARTP